MQICPRKKKMRHFEPLNEPFLSNLLMQLDKDYTIMQKHPHIIQEPFIWGVKHVLKPLTKDPSSWQKMDAMGYRNKSDDRMHAGYR